jgi:hypothetical protein
MVIIRVATNSSLTSKGQRFRQYPAGVLVGPSMELPPSGRDNGHLEKRRFGTQEVYMINSGKNVTARPATSADNAFAKLMQQTAPYRLIHVVLTIHPTHFDDE